MATKKWTVSHEALKPDPVYNSKLATKFVNCMMLKGKKSVSQKIFYDMMKKVCELVPVASPRGESASEISSKAFKAFDGKDPASPSARAEAGRNPVEIFETAVNNVKPLFEVRSKRVGGASYQVPMQVKAHRQQSLAIRWIIEAARSKKGRQMSDRLAAEIVDAYNRQGGAMATRENVHKMAEANKAFAHFAW